MSSESEDDMPVGGRDIPEHLPPLGPPTPPPPLPPPPSDPPSHCGSVHNYPMTDPHDMCPIRPQDGTGTLDNTKTVSIGRRPQQYPGCNGLHILSGLYARLLVVATAVLLGTELLQNRIPMLFFNGYVFTFLLGGGIVCLMTIYISMMVDKCPELTGTTHSSDLESGTSRPKKANVVLTDLNLFLRIGALVFGLGSVIASGLEIATIFTLESPCTDELNFALPIVHALFTFLQMHFLFLDVQSAVRSLGWFRHLALMHLLATNLAVWVRLVLWEATNDWLKASHTLPASLDPFQTLKGYNVVTHSLDTFGRHKVYVTSDCLWRLSEEHRPEGVLSLYQCLQNSTVGAVWAKALPFLYPFMTQYSLVAVAVSYVLWSTSSSMARPPKKKVQPEHDGEAVGESKSGTNLKLDCRGSSKGLFLGILVLVAGIIILILFFVLTKSSGLQFDTLFAIMTLHCTVLGVSLLASLLGLCQVQQLKPQARHSGRLQKCSEMFTILAVYAYSTCCVIVGGLRLDDTKHLVLMVDGILAILQAGMQSLFIRQVAHRMCKQSKDRSRPGRQVVVFMVFTNMVLWLIETFTIQKHSTSQLQLLFYGAVPWGIVSRIILPLVIFYRFHSAASLMEAWKHSYKTK